MWWGLRLLQPEAGQCLSNGDEGCCSVDEYEEGTDNAEGKASVEEDGEGLGSLVGGVGEPLLEDAVGNVLRGGEVGVAFRLLAVGAFLGGVLGTQDVQDLAGNRLLLAVGTQCGEDPGHLVILRLDLVGKITGDAVYDLVFEAIETLRLSCGSAENVTATAVAVATRVRENERFMGTP